MSRMPSRARVGERRQRERRRSYLIWGSVGLAAAALVGLVVWNRVKKPIGEAMPIMSAEHIQEGSLPAGGYNTEPPTSGPHYDAPLPAGFYQEDQLEELGETAVGHLVHSLEHGYVIFWYDCGELPAEQSCSALKSDLQSLLDDFNQVKVIAFPRPELDSPVVATSWGRMLKFETFDPRTARTFVNRNRNQAPEPFAD